MKRIDWNHNGKHDFFDDFMDLQVASALFDDDDDDSDDFYDDSYDDLDYNDDDEFGDSDDVFDDKYYDSSDVSSSASYTSDDSHQNISSDSTNEGKFDPNAGDGVDIAVIVALAVIPFLFILDIDWSLIGDFIAFGIVAFLIIRWFTNCETMRKSL